MDTRVYDCIVVGAGVIGSSAAYAATKQGYNTLLLEQFALPHTRGSSHGQSRLLSFIDNGPLKLSMTGEALATWKQIEEHTNATLFVQLGHMVLKSKEGIKDLNKNLELMKTYRRPYNVMTKDEAERRFPMVRVPEGYTAVLDQNAGLLKADKCLHALWTLIRRHGGTIRDEQKVVQIVGGDVVTVITDNQTYRGRRLILCPGPWAKDLTCNMDLNLPLKTMKGMGVYCRDKGGNVFTAGTFPTTIDEVKHKSGYRFYCMFPSVEYPGLVKFITRGEPPAKYIHPDDRDTDTGAHMVALLTDYIMERTPGIEHTPSIIEPAVYTMSPDRSPIIDFHPKHRNVVYAAGMSGAGFQNAPVFGKLLIEMAFGLPLSYDITELCANRFTSKL